MSLKQKHSSKFERFVMVVIGSIAVLLGGVTALLLGGDFFSSKHTMPSYVFLGLVFGLCCVLIPYGYKMIRGGANREGVMFPAWLLYLGAGVFFISAVISVFTGIWGQVLTSLTVGWACVKLAKRRAKGLADIPKSDEPIEPE
jgi:hypothetical protein